MYTVELYEGAVRLAESLGYQIRQEVLAGVGGGACEVAGRKCLFVDLTLSPPEQLDQILDAIKSDPGHFLADSVPGQLRKVLGLREAA
jgi:hypothetical protein